MQITRLKPIKGKTASTNTPVETVIVPRTTERVLLQNMSVDMGATESTLYVLQTKTAHSFSQKTVGNKLVIENCPTGYEGRIAVIRFNDSSTKTVRITAQSQNQLTLNESIAITEKAKLYVLEKSTDSGVQFYTKEAGEQSFSAQTYGFAVGEELGYPIAVWNANTAGDFCIQGGVSAFVSI